MLAGIMSEMVAADEVTKVNESLIATDEEVVAMCIETSTTNVHPVGQTSSPIFPTTVADQMPAPITNAHLMCLTLVHTHYLSTGKKQSVCVSLEDRCGGVL
jgi:hypothetical protein